MTISAIRVPQNSYLHVEKCFVEKHERVAPGVPLIEAIYPDGITTIITAETWGTIEHITSANTLLCANDIIYDISNDMTATVRGKTGLQMKPSTWMRARNRGELHL